jgi:hypothetical protein
LLLVEAERNLQEKLPRALPEYQHFLAVCPLEIVPAPFAWQIKVAGAIIHPKDAPILAAAMSARIDYLVTHNRKHFLDDPEVPRRSGLTIGTPGDFLAWFRGQLAT